MTKAGWSKEVGRILREAVDREDAHPAVACRWARWCAARNDRAFEQWIGRVSGAKQWADRAVGADIEALSKARNARAFDRFVAGNRPWLRASSTTWGWVAHGMAVLQQYRRGAAWAADWQQRGDAEAWMLINAAESFWGIGNNAEMAALCMHVQSLPESPVHEWVRVLLAADATLHSDLARCAA